MKVKKGDTILVISGKDKGKTAKIVKAFPKEGQILVEGVNLKKKHIRPKREGEKGQVVQLPAPINVSNAKVICPKCGKATRIGYKIEKSSDKTSVKSKKERICKKCKSKI
jgi:large subunit ribosomal protein L24